MANTTKATVDILFDDSPVDVTTEVNFIWSIANKLRGPYRISLEAHIEATNTRMSLFR